MIISETSTLPNLNWTVCVRPRSFEVREFSAGIGASRGGFSEACQVSNQLPQDKRQVNPVRGEVRVQVRRGGINRLRLLRDQGGAALVGEQDVGQGVWPVALRGKDVLLLNCSGRQDCLA